MRNCVRVRTVLRAFVLAFPLAFAACSSAPYSLETPDVAVTGLTLLESNQSGQRYSIQLELTNPNDFGMSVRSIKFRLRIAGEGFIDAESGEPISLPASQSASLRVVAQTDFVSSVSRLMSYLQGPESTLPYDIAGELALDTRPPRFLRFSESGRTPLLITAAGG